MTYLKINKCYTVLYNVCYFKDSTLSENTDKCIGIEDKSCPYARQQCVERLKLYLPGSCVISNMKQIGATYIRASHSYNCLFSID